MLCGNHSPANRKGLWKHSSQVYLRWPTLHQALVFPPITHGVVIDFPPLSFNSKCGFRKLEERQMTECQPLLRLILELESESVNRDRELQGRRLRKGSPVAGNTLDPLATQMAQLPL